MGQDRRSDIIARLRKAANEIAQAGHAGWGNIMLDAADALGVSRVTDEMVEAAARALCVADGLDPDEDWRQVPGGAFCDAAVDPATAQRWRTYIGKARAALDTPPARDEGYGVGWQPIETAPRDRPIEARFDNSDVEPYEIEWAETRQCMLAGIGGGNGYYGEGWQDTENRLVCHDKPTHWREVTIPAAVQEAER